MDFYTLMSNQAKGKHLTRLAMLVFGVKRKWFGLESDKAFRRRLASILIKDQPN